MAGRRPLAGPGVPPGRAWLVVLALLAAVLSQVGGHAWHRHDQGHAALSSAHGDHQAPRDPRRDPPDDHGRHGCEQCERYTLAKLGLAPGTPPPGIPAPPAIPAGDAWDRAAEPETRGLGTARARGPPPHG